MLCRLTHVVQVAGDEAMKELRRVRGALTGADDGTVPYTLKYESVSLCEDRYY